MAELKRIFESVHSLNGHGSKAEIHSSLQNEEQDLAALLKEAGLNELLDLMNKLLGHEGDFVSWEEFQQFAEKVVVEKIQEDMKVVEQEVAKDLALGDKAIQWLKEVFDKIIADEEGAVSKEDLVVRLKKDLEEVGQEIAKMMEDAGFNPQWSSLEQLDTNKDGFVTWEEFQAHVRPVAQELEEEIELVVRKKCVFCC